MDRKDIPIGRENAITRAELAAAWGFSDRKTRKMIAQLRALPGNDGYAILSSSTAPNGYWRSNDPAEIERFILETESRAKNVFLSLKDAKRILHSAETSGQMQFQLGG